MWPWQGTLHTLGCYLVSLHLTTDTTAIFQGKRDISDFLKPSLCQCESSWLFDMVVHHWWTAIIELPPPSQSISQWLMQVKSIGIMFEPTKVYLKSCHTRAPPYFLWPPSCCVPDPPWATDCGAPLTATCRPLVCLLPPSRVIKRTAWESPCLNTIWGDPTYPYGCAWSVHVFHFPL